MEIFKLKKFSIVQSKKVFRIGTDAMLLGALSSPNDYGTALEVGVGSGIISLMLAQRTSQLSITAIDLNEEAVKVATENFENSPFSKRLKCLHQDFKTIETETKFDFIFSNPPYFEKNSSVKDVLARQKTELSFDVLISKSSELLSPEGILSLIIPSQEVESILKIAKENQLYFSRQINIYGIEGGKLKRSILEFSKVEKKFTLSNFVIEKTPRNYSEQYLKLLKDFHVFGSEVTQKAP